MKKDHREGIKHADPCRIAGKKVKIKNGSMAGWSFKVEDWFDRIEKRSWEIGHGPECFMYAVRIARQPFRVPMNDEVLRGTVYSTEGKEIERVLVHEKEIEERC